MSGWAAVAQGAMDLVNGGLSLWGQSKAARRQWAQQKAALQNQHQWEVADLRKAGLNPMLSVNAGAGGASGGNAAFPQIDLGRNISRSYQNDLMKAQMTSAQEQINTQKELQNMYAKQGYQALTQGHVNQKMEDLISQNSAAAGMQNQFLSEQVKYMRAHPGARDFGNFMQLINPFNSAAGLMSSARGMFR